VLLSVELALLLALPPARTEKTFAKSTMTCHRCNIGASRPTLPLLWRFSD
jgi:hypothetical protein